MNDANPVPSQASPARNRLPPTRSSITHKFEIDELDGYIIVGLYPDGRPGEVFLKMGKEGSMVGGLLDSIGILTSIPLQHGVPLERLTAKLSHVRFEPSGRTSHEQVRYAKSVVDYVFRWLELTFVESGREQDGPDAKSG